MKTPYREQLAPILHQGESIIWADRPESGIKLRKVDYFLIPFGFAWGGFALFWEYMVWEEGFPWFFKLFGIPFVLIGLYLMLGRFYHDKLIRDNTVYAITDQGRVLIKSGISKKTLNHYKISALKAINISFKRGKNGSISFEDRYNKPSKQGAWLDDYAKQFAHIQHPQKVHDLLMSFRN